MTDVELRRKFDDNASGFLSPGERDRIVAEIRQLDQLPDASVLVGLAVAADRRTARKLGSEEVRK